MLLQCEPKRIWGNCCNACVHCYMTNCHAAGILSNEVLVLSIKRLTWTKVTLQFLRASGFLKKICSHWLLCAVYLQLNRVAEEKAGIGIKVTGVREWHRTQNILELPECLINTVVFSQLYWISHKQISTVCGLCYHYWLWFSIDKNKIECTLCALCGRILLVPTEALSVHLWRNTTFATKEWK